MLLANKQKTDRQQLADLFHFYQSNNEVIYQNEILDYYKKLDKQMLHICFSGHFSAGKSTLLNHLMGESLLPQSPIPTSANIVEIKQGKEKAVVHFTKQAPIEMPSLPPTEQLHQLCQNGEEIKKVEIYKETAELPKGVTLMDTPGIDASNDADRLMTESSLHQVDVLFYVMDYNHVQSEVNATFLKQIDGMNKPYYVVINQMDKHDNNEISFVEFQNSLHAVFNQWGIKPQKLFFTTMTGKEGAINQFSQIQKTLYLLWENDELLLNKTLSNGVAYSVQKSIESQRKKMDDQIQQLDEEIADISLPENTTFKETEEKANAYKYTINNMEKEYGDIVGKTTENAQIIPYEVREKARLLLEAYEPKFKVGLFKNRKKIKEERKRRLEAFYQLLKEKAEAGIEWKLREKVAEFLQPYYSIHLTEAIFTTQFRQETLIHLIKEGATLNGEYVLHYTNQVAQAIKKVFRQYYKQLWNELAGDILSPIQKSYQQQKEWLAQFQHFHQLQQRIEKEKASFITYKNRAEALWRKENDTENSNIANVEQILLEEQVKKVTELQYWKAPPQQEEDAQANRAHTKKVSEHRFSYQQTLEHATRVTEEANDVAGLQKLRQELLQKKSRLTNRHFTVALFGAFSAGKSSFANALIGEKVLPVSPNPTTAAINKISPVQHPFEHRDVAVVMKDEKQLLTDIGMIIEKEFKHLETAYKWLHKTKIEKLQIPDQHKSFLTAFLQGFSEMKENIGKTYTIDFETFHHFVREESMACFIREMELFYDCKLTRQHITLVDTPGADSVNARHTDLAFSYIKDADAILFVTYYNHPFSKPDQQFLERLGKVKESFELDKMFFLINAIDLATDREEKEMVIDYVRNELLQFGIHNPSMYAISSKEALVSKSDKTGLPQFEKHFYRFIQEELLQMTMKSVYTDMRRIYGLVNNWLSILNSDLEEIERLMEQYNAYQTEIETIIQNRHQHVYFEQINQKLTKQIFYSIQRFEIQFTDIWKNDIHPGVIQSSGRKGRIELKEAIYSMTKSIEKRIQAEYEAIAIRLEQTWNQKNQDLHSDLEKEMKQVDEHFKLSEVERIALPNPEINIRKIAVDKNALSNWLSSYKDSKAFFAEGGRQKLEEQLKSYFISEWKKSMDQLENRLRSFYQDMWEVKISQIWSGYTEEVKNYYKQVTAGISGQEGDKEALEKISHLLRGILEDKQLA